MLSQHNTLWNWKCYSLNWFCRVKLLISQLAKTVLIILKINPLSITFSLSDNNISYFRCLESFGDNFPENTFFTILCHFHFIFNGTFQNYLLILRWSGNKKQGQSHYHQSIQSFPFPYHLSKQFPFSNQFIASLSASETSRLYEMRSIHRFEVAEKWSVKLRRVRDKFSGNFPGINLFNSIWWGLETR